MAFAETSRSELLVLELVLELGLGSLRSLLRCRVGRALSDELAGGVSCAGLKGEEEGEEEAEEVGAEGTEGSG